MLKLTNKEKAVINGRFSENALRMMKKRYLTENSDGASETPADMFYRVAVDLAQQEAKYGKKEKDIEKVARDFLSIMAEKEYTPAGRTLTNAGSETPLIANCIVLPIHDSMESIFQTLKDAALLQQAGSGLGFDLSEMRPAMFPTKKSRGEASGPVSFLKVYDAAFGTIKQQCFAKGTRIVTKRGLVPIEEVKKGDETYTEKGWKQVTELFFNGVRNTVRLTLDSGFEIELTPNHKVAVIYGKEIALKLAKDLREEDVLLMKLGDGLPNGKKVTLKAATYHKSKYTSFQLQEIRQPRILDEKLAYLLGLYYADGWNDSQGLGFCVPDSDKIEQYARNLATELFGVRTLASKAEGEDCRKVKVNSVWAKQYLKANGLLKQHAWEIVVPEKILRSPGSVQMAFVAGFFDGDGDNGKNYRLSSTSKTFIRQLQLVLLNNGIGAKFLEDQRKEDWRIVYRLSAIGKISSERFINLLSPLSWKLKAKDARKKDFGWIFPFHPVHDLGYSWTDIKRLHDGVRSTISHSALSQIQARVFLQQAEAAVQQKVDWTGFLPTHIKRIESAGRQEVYDFEVEDIHMINAGLYTTNSRHGANMAMMRVDHPDILDFISCKEKEGDIRNFNVSVTVTDEFMEQLEKNPDKQWMCAFGGKKMKPRKVSRHPNGTVYKTEETDVTVRELFDLLVEHAWLNGEPGIGFIDTINRTNPLPGMGPIQASNPCGEQFLHAYDNCNLGSLNLAQFVKDGKVDFARLKFSTRTAVRLMDNVIDKFDFPVEQVTELAKKNRRIGLGIMGFADMLYQLGVRYDSKKGLETAEKVMGFINKEAYAYSQELAKEKGTFPNYKLSVFAKKASFPHASAQEWGMGKKMRNAALTTVAPTGSISMMFDTSSGIEPNFALAYIKQDKDGQRYQYFNLHFKKALDKLKFSKSRQEKILKEVVDKGSIQHLQDLPQELRDTFVVAMDISGKDHMEMQAAFQRNVDNSISKTVNFPNEATKEEVGATFVQAWKLGCKACTVYRDGSRVIQILNVGNGDNIVAPTEVPMQGKPSLSMTAEQGKPRPRPEIMSGNTYRIKTGYGNVYITVNNDEKGKPFEVFATIGKSGGFFQEQSEAICKLISRSLRAGVAAQEVINDLKGIRGPMPIFTDKGTVLSLPDAIGKTLEQHVEATSLVQEVVARPEKQDVLPLEGKQERKISMANFGFMPGCPECGTQLVMQEGCISCKACGFSRCS